jgi:hypothetical protein
VVGYASLLGLRFAFSPPYGVFRTSDGTRWRFVPSYFACALSHPTSLALCPSLLRWRFVPSYFAGALSHPTSLALCPILLRWRFVPSYFAGALSHLTSLALCPSLLRWRFVYFAKIISPIDFLVVKCCDLYNYINAMRVGDNG